MRVRECVFVGTQTGLKGTAACFHPPIQRAVSRLRQRQQRRDISILKHRHLFKKVASIGHARGSGQHFKCSFDSLGKRKRNREKNKLLTDQKSLACLRINEATLWRQSDEIRTYNHAV